MMRKLRPRVSSLSAAVLSTLIAASMVLLSSAHGEGHLKAAEPESFAVLGREYNVRIHALVERFCLDCHSSEAKEGELDLERFARLEDIRRDPAAWQKVADMLATGEMPPEDAPQPTPEERAKLQDWVRQYLNAEALANAGDPGPVVLRRLNNAEYTYTIQDLTGVTLEPAKEFPTDGAAGEGFTNTGQALSMSPALVTKYLAAAKDIAGHAVLLPQGIRFSEHTTRRDLTNEYLDQIREIYFRYTGRLGDASRLDRWNVSNPMEVTDEDGRVDLARYFRLLIEQRERLAGGSQPLREVVDKIANAEGLSPKYLGVLAETLLRDDDSMLLNQLRTRWRTADPGDAPALAADIRAWQDRLWSFHPVGHFGLVRNWQQPETPLIASQSFREQLSPTGQDPLTLLLVTGAAGDSPGSDTVIWERPRLERTGRPAILLQDLKAYSVAIEQLRQDAIATTRNSLAAAFEAKSQPQVDFNALAAAHGIDPLVLKQWIRVLGIATSDELVIQSYLDQPLRRVGGYEFVNGWGMAGADALSLVANSSDEIVRIPGEMNPHSVAVHPRPERWIAAGWKSPMTGQVRVSASVRHAHPACGNGVSWSLELRSGSQRRVLREGVLGLGESAESKLVSPVGIKKGELISLVIGPHERDHSCDLTQIDLKLEEVGGEGRQWSLSGDCADSIEAGNPHADRYGQQDVWHFYSDLIEGTAPEAAIPPGSFLAEWSEATDAATADLLAAKIESLLESPLPDDATIPNATLRQLLTSLIGPLFSGIDPAELASRADRQAVENSPYGVSEGNFRDGNLIVQAPSVMEVRIPAEIAAGATFVSSAALSPNSNGEGSVQLQVLTGDQPHNPLMDAPGGEASLLPGVPVVVRPGSPAEQRFQKSFEEFRDLFPLAMCYPRIVPVDVVVTLVLFHREDEHLRRLMLNDEEAAQLDRLWNELHFVARDALTIVTVFEQLLEFASQDDDPEKYRPLGEPIRARAAAFEQQLATAEPTHLDAVLDLANRAYRRPLTSEQAEGLRRLYAELRQQDLPHEEAVRLLLARVISSPTFLYRYEQPATGERSAPVDDWELATRLSYFLWSSLPDEELRSLAAAGQLTQTDVLLAQTRRMVQDDRIRRLAIEFGCQWLHVRAFDEFNEKSEEAFPEFAEYRGDMYEESVRFFQDMFQNDRSILELIDADHTILNERLARLYGIDGITGDEWRLVTGTREHHRGGILTQATTLATQSGASRTSPILRGTWVSETLLGERLPRPPANIPLLPESETDTGGLTFRQLVEKHGSDPACYKCHKRIDPLGFPFENFDAIGRYREVDASGRPFDTQTTVMDGTPIDGLDGLRHYLSVTRRDAFVRQFCRKLLGYALGRSVQLSDEPLLTEMQTKLAEHDFRFSAALETIVTSRQFREIRSRDAEIHLDAN